MTEDAITDIPVAAPKRKQRLSRAAYIDCEQLLDKALAGAKGVRVTYLTAGKANYEVKRLHAFRVLDRELSKRIYPENDPKYETSVYDTLIFSRPKGSATIEVIKRSADRWNIEEI